MSGEKDRTYFIKGNLFKGSSSGKILFYSVDGKRNKKASDMCSLIMTRTTFCVSTLTRINHKARGIVIDIKYGDILQGS